MKESPEKKTVSEKNIPYAIPVQGSLGLLALGAKGLDLWRKKKQEVKHAQGSHSPNEKK